MLYLSDAMAMTAFLSACSSSKSGTVCPPSQTTVSRGRPASNILSNTHAKVTCVVIRPYHAARHYPRFPRIEEDKLGDLYQPSPGLPQCYHDGPLPVPLDSSGLPK